MKYAQKVREHFKDAPTFTLADVRVFLGRGISEGYLHGLIHHLLARKELKRVTKGVYTFRDDVQVAGFAFRPFYYGLQDALSLRNAWEQETNPVILTPRRVRTGVRVFEGRNYLVRHIDRKLFYGYDLVPYADFWVPVSTLEKTLIDYAYFHEKLDEQTLREIQSRLKPRLLENYLRRLPPKLAKKIKKQLQPEKKR